jgi:RNA polymerase sigma factor (TIGR02999 family)
VHEAYLKLVDQRRVRWQNRRHFFGIAAQAMRRILVDRVRAQKAGKRGAGGLGVEPDARDVPQLPPDVDVLALDEALSRLEALEPRWSRLVELRFFAGLTVGETASVLGVSPATVKRDWSFARGWLYRELRPLPAQADPLEVRLIDPATGQDRLLGSLVGVADRFVGPAVSSDGADFLYAKLASDIQDLMVIENFR